MMAMHEKVEDIREAAERVLATEFITGEEINRTVLFVIANCLLILTERIMDSGIEINGNVASFNVRLFLRIP